MRDERLLHQKIRCAHCKKRIKAHEPDLMLRKDSGPARYFHTRCGGAAYTMASSEPGLWFLAVRHVDEAAN